MTKKKMGRPRIEFDPEQVQALAELQCTMEEIASGLGISVDTLANRRKEDPAFSEAIEKGRDVGKRSLRRSQYDCAMSGNPTMMIWLGKQWLGQKDRTETDIHAEVEGPFILQFDKRYEKA